MKKKICKLFFLEAFFISPSPGVGETIRVGDLELTDRLTRCLSVLNPAFTAGANTNALKRALYKHYLGPQTKTDDFRARNMTLAPEEVRTLDLIKQIAADRYLAFSIAESLEQELFVSNEEALVFYETHPERYTRFGRVSFIQVYLADTSEETIAQAKGHMESLLRSGDPEAILKKAETSGYAINFESHHESRLFPRLPRSGTLHGLRTLSTGR